MNRFFGIESAASQDAAAEDAPVAIIDVGSNSVRMVVYRGRGRMPPVLFNEKTMCALGLGVAISGRLDPDAREMALKTLKRFALLAREMGCTDVSAVATAAIRQAADGAQFIEQVTARTGLRLDRISGEQEAEYSALGVLSGIPAADGVVGDLGGGSLELARVCRGSVFERVSIPIGSFVTGAATEQAIRSSLARALKPYGWLRDARDKSIYAVGGSWRALAHLDMHETSHPLPILHQYRLTPDRPLALGAIASRLDKRRVKLIPNVSERRLTAMPGAAVTLDTLLLLTGARDAIISAHGVREGLLFSRLSPEERAEDPLLAACRQEAGEESRFHSNGDRLMDWLDPLLSQGEDPRDRRLRHAACLLSDVAWRGHPDFRAERALDASLYGNWVGIDARERMMLGIALFVCYGGAPPAALLDMVAKLCTPDDLQIARVWGLALRLGQRLCGGAVQMLVRTGLLRDGRRLVLQLPEDYVDLFGEVVERRLEALAGALELQPSVTIGRVRVPAG